MIDKKINFSSYKTRLILFLFAFLLVIILSSCSSMQKVNSQWKDNTKETVIDGKADDWAQSLIYFEKENILIGTRNDNENLYLCIKSNDREVARKFFMTGFTIWLNTEANKTKSIGIHYPLGAMGSGKFKENFDREADKKKDNTGAYKDNDRFESMLQDMELLKGEDQEHIPVSLIEIKKKYGINAKITNDEDIMTYEIAIPLTADLFGIKLKDCKDMQIGIGFETGEFKKPDFGSMSSQKGGAIPTFGDGGGNSPGGMPPMGGGSGGRGGGMRTGGKGEGRGGMHSDMKSMNEQIQLWIELKLAEK